MLKTTQKNDEPSLCRHPLSLHYAKHLLKEEYTDERGLFISQIIQSAREGHLCCKISHAPTLPCMEEGASLFPKSPIVKEGDRYYLQKNWVYETYLIEQIRRLRKREMPVPSWEGNEELNEEQTRAVKQMLAQPFSILCGGPGTGKTYTAGIFVRILLQSMQKKFRIVLAAPTGKAALHLHSTLLSKVSLPPHVSCVASTLHRLLKIKRGEISLFTKKRIDADLIIVDEASMMDISLLCSLLESTGEHTRLILMGDPHQLPPIEAGSAFAECAELFGVFLKRCMRTEDLQLQETAAAILGGDVERFFALTPISEDWDEALFDRLYEKIRPFFSPEKVEIHRVLEAVKEVRLLNCMRQGPFGIEALNLKILERIGKECKENFWWAIPILATANIPHLNLYNGSEGVLIGQRKGNFRLSDGRAYFPEYGEAPLKNPPPYEVSFFLSVHKSQGSEFDEVVVLIPPGSEHFGKEVLYTAATRAKRKWEVVGKKEILTQLIQQESRKVSGLTERMKDLAQKEESSIKFDLSSFWKDG